MPQALAKMLCLWPGAAGNRASLLLRPSPEDVKGGQRKGSHPAQVLSYYCQVEGSPQRLRFQIVIKNSLPG